MATALRGRGWWEEEEEEEEEEAASELTFRNRSQTMDP